MGKDKVMEMGKHSHPLNRFRSLKACCTLFLLALPSPKVLSFATAQSLPTLSAPAPRAWSAGTRNVWSVTLL